MDITPEQVRAHRLRAHHLDRRYPASRILEAAGACGLQNSPPGGWETALFQRLEGCSLPLLRDALYRDRALLQAWSIDRKSTRLNSSHCLLSRMPSSA